MYKIGPVEKAIYKLREQHPLIIAQIDPDKYSEDMDSARAWLNGVRDAGISVIAMGGSLVSPLQIQKVLDLALDEYNFLVILYLTTSIGAIKGRKGRTAVYWAQVPNSLNTFYGWDGLVSNATNIERSNLEPFPTVYVFDDREFIGTANWVARSYPVPRQKPEVSLAVAKAAQYLGVRFYIMAGGSGSVKQPPASHVEALSKRSELFVIPTSGIKTLEHVKEMFSSGADAIHIGNKLEGEGGLKLLKEMVKISKSYPGRHFL